MAENSGSKTVTIHTDGACDGNPGPGGWAAVLRFGESIREVTGGEPATTNNRMELQAAISALKVLKERRHFHSTNASGTTQVTRFYGAIRVDS